MSHSLSAPGPASVVGELLTFQVRHGGILWSRFRFFETEGLAALAILIQRYKVEPSEKFPEETLEQVKERYSQAVWSFTLR